MSKMEKARLATFFISYTIVCAVTIRAEYLPKFLVPKMTPSFADLRIITSASECLENAAWSLISPTCDPWGRPFNYPTLWVKIFSSFGFAQNDTDFVGVIQIVLLCIFLGLWALIGFKSLAYYGDRKSLFALVVLMVLSPPILLLLERGNIDSWIFVGLSLVSYLMISGKFFLPVGLLGLLGALKIYPFVVFTFLIQKLTFSWKSVFLLFTLGASIISLSTEWQIILNRSLTNWNSISYGSSIFPLLMFQILGIPGSKALAAVVGWLIFASLVLTLSYSCRFQIQAMRAGAKNTPVIRIPILVFGAPFLFSFLVGASFDLRLVLLFPVVVCFFVLASTMNQQIVLVGTVSIIMYGGQLTSNFGELGMVINLFSDFTLSVFSAFLLLLIFPNIREGKLI